MRDTAKTDGLKHVEGSGFRVRVDPTVTLTIGGVEHRMTRDDARTLRDALSRELGDTVFLPYPGVTPSHEWDRAAWSGVKSGLTMCYEGGRG